MAGFNRKSVMTMHFFNSWMMRCVRWSLLAGLMVPVAVMVPVCLGGSQEAQVVHLYFSDAERPFLVAEARVMVNPGDPVASGRQLVAALIGGPVGGNLATVPAGTRLRALFVLTDGTAVVDFSTHFRENHPGSCRQEQLTLFSVVNSLILNVPGIDRVKILIDGAEAQTLAGHLPLEFPLTADMLLTR
jgi:spore germination protein GerM